MIRKRFSLRKTIIEDITFGCQNVCDALSFLLDNIYIRFGTKLYRQIFGIPMGTNCAPRVADLFSFCYERDFMKDLSSDNQADVIKAFNSTSRYLDDHLNIDNLISRFGFKSGICHLIAPVPVHCFSITFLAWQSPFSLPSVPDSQPHRGIQTSLSFATLTPCACFPPVECVSALIGVPQQGRRHH